MSTPVKSLPRGGQQAPSAIDDPMVRDVLMEEMETEVAVAKGPAARSPPPSYAQVPYPQQPPARFGAPPESGWWQAAYAQRAVAAAVLALLLLHPAAGQALGARVAALEVNAMYNLVARAALLAIVLYVVMWKLQL
jgi:hypothetical protein